MTQPLSENSITVDGMTVKQMTDYVSEFYQRMHPYFFRKTPPINLRITIADILPEGRASSNGEIEIRRKGPAIKGGLKGVLRHEASHILQIVGPGSKWDLSSYNLIPGEIVAETGNYVGGMMEGETIDSIFSVTPQAGFGIVVPELLRELPVNFRDDLYSGVIRDSQHLLLELQSMTIKRIRDLILKSLKRNFVYHDKKLEEMMNIACEQ